MPVRDPFGHDPVQEAEVIELLRPEPGDVVVDGTVGTGGHAERIAEAVGERGRVFGFDRDPAALAIAMQRLERFGDRVRLVHGNYREARRRLAEMGVARVQGALLDLGVSSIQLDQAERGFAFRADGPLDMRMSPGEGRTAADLVNDLSVGDLERILRDFGEEPRAWAIARKIVDVRQRTRIETTKELAELVRSATPGGGKTHPATRTFQALRIAVNDELGALKAALPDWLLMLDEGARFVVISFHSLEDRIVKQAFRDFADRGQGRIVGSIAASESERHRNRRSRSARTRAFERGQGS